MAVRLLGVTKTYLGARDKCRDAAAALASTFLTRPDTKSTLLPSFLEWAVQAMSAPNSLDGEITGALTALCAVMKHGKREDLMGDAPNILTSLLGANFKESSNTNIRKLNLKLVQRLGMIFLKVITCCPPFLSPNIILIFISKVESGGLAISTWLSQSRGHPGQQPREGGAGDRRGRR